MIKRDVQDFDGMFAGQYDPEEYEHFIKSGELYKSYEGAGGFLGLAKLRIVSPSLEVYE